MAVDCHHIVASCGHVTAEYYILVDRLTYTTSLSIQGLYTAFRLIGGRNGGTGGRFRYCQWQRRSVKKVVYALQLGCSFFHITTKDQAAKGRLNKAIGCFCSLAIGFALYSSLQGRQGSYIGWSICSRGRVEAVAAGSDYQELYCRQAGCGGSYELSCRSSLALVNKEGKASRAYTDRACADRAYTDGAYIGGACIGGAYTGRACADKACAGGAYIDRAYTGRGYTDGGYTDGGYIDEGYAGRAQGRAYTDIAYIDGA